MSHRQSVLFISVLAVAFVLVACQPSSTPSPSSSPAAEMTTGASPAVEFAAMDEVMLAPGSRELSTQTSYMSPAGEEAVAFTLVVDAEGTVTDARTEVLGKSPTTIMRQTSFAESLPEAIVGMKLSELSNIDRVGGSSLTTGAFNKSLPVLQAQI